MPAPFGNRNAAQHVSDQVRYAYAHLVAFGFMSREQACSELRIGPGRARRWLRAEFFVGPPDPAHIAVRNRFVKSATLVGRQIAKRRVLSLQLADLNQRKL